MFRAKDDDVIVLDADEKENDESQEKPEVEVSRPKLCNFFS